MTTGRINQVTTFRPCTPKSATHDSHDKSLSRSGVSLIGRRFSCNLRELSAISHTSNPKPTTKTPYSPVSQISDTLLLVTRSNKDHGLQRELPTTGALTQQSWRIPKWLNATRFSYQQVIHSLLQCKHQRYSTFVSRGTRRLNNCSANTHPKSV